MTRRRLRSGALPEAAFQLQVEQLAAFYGWLAYHTHDSRRSAAGFPDLVLVRAPELIVAELKSAAGTTSPAQEAWLEQLRLVASATTKAADALAREADRVLEQPEAIPLPALEVYVWRPHQLEEIHQRLARGRVLQTPLA